MTKRQGQEKGRTSSVERALEQEFVDTTDGLNAMADRAMLHRRLTVVDVEVLEDALLFLAMAADPKTPPRQREALLRSVRDALGTVREDLMDYAEQCRVLPK